MDRSRPTPEMAAPLRLGVAGAVIALLASVFGFWGFHKFLAYKINQNAAIVKGNDMRKMWSKLPIPLEFRMYLFNVTNPLEVHNGAKPHMQEIGPYFFDEWKEKLKLEDDPVEDTVSFSQRNTWIFQPDKSFPGLTGDEMVTIPHPVLLTMVLTVERDKPAAIPMIAKALPALFNGPETVFVTARAMDILFNGIPINCSSKDFGPKAICTTIRKDPKSLTPDGDNFLFSFFGRKNGTMEEARFTVKRGFRNAQEVGKMVMYNGEPELKVWSGPECNALRGTDSTIFPPFIQDGANVDSFAADICMSTSAKFSHKVVYKGIQGNHYTANFGDQSTIPEEKCFCPTPTTCMKKGALELSKCLGAPLVATLPHFYEADEYYLNQVTGLNPDKEKHQISVNFEPISGTPLAARKRMQFNIPIHPIAKLDLMKNVPEALVPLMWVEEGMDLDQKFLDILEANLFRTMRIVGVGKWVLLSLGIAMVGGGVGLFYYRKNKIQAPTVTKVSPPPKY